MRQQKIVVLAGERRPGAPGEKKKQFGFNTASAAASLAIHKAFCAVTALHDEALATATLCQQPLESITLVWLHQRWKFA